MDNDDEDKDDQEDGDDDEDDEDDGEPSCDDSDDSENPKKSKKKPRTRRTEVVDEVLLKREATLLELVRKLGMNKVIVFFNEKKQVERMITLFLMYGFKAA